MDMKIIKKQMEKHPELAELISMCLENSCEAYKYLYSLKNSIPKELYAYRLRELWKMKTHQVPTELALHMFEGVLPEDIMYEDELKRIKQLDDFVTVYRGAEISEEKPRLSWTLRKSVATSSDFARGILFKAKVPKEDILLYIAHDGDEEEVVVHVTANYERIYLDD